MLFSPYILTNTLSLICFQSSASSPLSGFSLVIYLTVTTTSGLWSRAVADKCWITELSPPFHQEAGGSSWVLMLWVSGTHKRTLTLGQPTAPSESASFLLWVQIPFLCPPPLPWPQVTMGTLGIILASVQLIFLIQLTFFSEVTEPSLLSLTRNFTKPSVSRMMPVCR